MSVCIIPCCAAKRSEPAAARELYVSPNFRLQLRAAEAIADEVLILSALHGLVPLNMQLEPYDVRMGDPTAISPAVLATQVWFRNLDAEQVTALLPKAYYDCLLEACRLAGCPPPANLFAGTKGIGEQRAVASKLARSAA